MNRSIVIVRSAFIASMLLLAACGGGGGGGGAAPPPSTYTVGGTVSGVIGGGLVLRNNGGDDLAVSGNGSFTFATALANQGGYSVTVATSPASQTCTVTNGSGTIAGANVTNVAVNCANTNKAWGAAALIETNNAGHAYAPQIAINANGNAFAVWAQYDGASSGFGAPASVWANRYIAGTGWGTAERIEADDNFGSAYNPQIAVDTNGNALAVWDELDGSTVGNTNIVNIWANRYTAGQGWGTPVLIEAGAERASAPQIAMDANGNALAVWLQDSWSIKQVWANRYIAGTGWGTPVRIDNISSSALPPQIAVDANGNAIAVWGQSSGIAANRYTAGTGWGTAASIVTSGRDVQIAMNASGSAFVVWDTYDSVNANYSIWSKRYLVGGGWQPDEQIDFNLSSGGSPQIAINAAGDGFAVWTKLVGGSYHIYTIKRPVATNWGTTVRVDSDTGSAGTPKIAVNANGDAFAVWAQSDGTRSNIWSNRRLAADTTWGTAELIETDNAGSAYDPRVVVDTNGNALSVWRQNDGTRDNIWANRFQ